MKRHDFGIGRDGGTTVYIIDGFMGEDDARKVRRCAVLLVFLGQLLLACGAGANTKDLASVYTDKVSAA